MENSIYEMIDDGNIKNTNKKIEILIAIAISFSPFNKLRVAGIGITEVLLLLLTFYCMAVLKDAKVSKTDNQVSRMYFFILFGSVLGYMYNMFFLGDIGEFSSTIFNFVSYGICMICCYGIEVLLRNNVVNPKTILDRTFCLLSILVAFLFLVSRFTSSFAGFSLMYYSYFCPLSDNIHQLAMIISMFPFIGLYLLFEKKNFAVKLLYLIMSVMDVIIGINTGSSKFILGLIVGGIALLLLIIINSAGRMKIVMVGGVLLAALIVLTTNYQLFLSLFRDNDVHGGRETLYINGLKMVMNSPVFGYGPSIVITNVYGKLMDAHETILASYLAGGILAFWALIVTTYKRFKLLLNNKWLFASMCGFLVYFLGGDVLRKECMWIMLILTSQSVISDKHSYCNTPEVI